MSSTLLHAIAVLENPRVIPKTKTVVFDGQIFLPSSEPALIGSFRYFNTNDIQLLEVGCYSVDMRVARTNPTVEVFSQDLTPIDYNIMGDIASLIPLGSPESLDLCHPSYATVCGVAHSINRDDATFELNAEQYLSATRASEAFPTRCLIPSIPKFNKFKPIPGDGKSATVSGFLTGLERNDDKMVKHFIVDVDTVTFHGGSTAPKAEQSPAKIVNGTPARLKFTGFFGSQGSDTHSDEPAQKKRKTADDRAQEEANDKGEGSSTGRPRRHPHD
ncbi:hypothetical protein C8J57DRAFT_1532514 [Mycena rebaudengoi]|nr:hypothetical protein C8J57DRAFT_1532514 [Mycena rebaudengoi]